MHFLYLVVALSILLLPSPIWASDIAPLTLESDFLLYSPDYNIILAEENINLKYKDITFVASQLQIDLGKGRITAQGDVQLKGEDETLKGDALNYDFEENKGSIFIIGENIQEIPFAEKKGGFLRLDKGEGRIDSTIPEFDIPSATKSFLYITAKRMKIYPKVEIRAWKVTLWNRRNPFLTLPYLPWKIGDIKLPNTFSLKQLSYNSAKGLLIEAEYNYVLSKALSGRILSSYNSKDKLSTIVRGNYSLGRGSLIYLLLRFPSNDEIKYHIIYKQRLSINFGSELTFIYWPQREDPWQGKYELSLNSPPLKSSLTISRGESYDYERRGDWKTKLKLDLDRMRIGETKWSYSISSSLSLEKGKLDPLSFWEEDMSVKLDRDSIPLTDKLSLTPSLELTREWYSYLPQQDELRGSLKLIYEASPKWSYELGYNNILRSRSIFSSPDSWQHIIEGKIKHSSLPVGSDSKRWETSLSLDYDLTGGMLRRGIIRYRLANNEKEFKSSILSDKFIPLGIIACVFDYKLLPNLEIGNALQYDLITDSMRFNLTKLKWEFSQGWWIDLDCKYDFGKTEFRSLDLALERDIGQQKLRFSWNGINNVTKLETVFER